MEAGKHFNNKKRQQVSSSIPGWSVSPLPE